MKGRQNILVSLFLCINVSIQTRFSQMIPKSCTYNLGSVSLLRRADILQGKTINIDADKIS